MDVDREIAAANARIRRQIDRSADAALAHMNARWPSTVEPDVAPARTTLSVGAWLARVQNALEDGLRQLARDYYANRVVADPRSAVISKGPYS